MCYIGLTAIRIFLALLPSDLTIFSIWFCNFICYMKEEQLCCFVSVESQYKTFSFQNCLVAT